MAVAATRVLALRITDEYVDSVARERGGELSPRAELDAAHEAQSAVADEIVIATGVGKALARDLVGVACAAPERTSVAMTKMLAGEASFYRAATLWRECVDLPAHVANEVADRALAPTRDGVPLSQRLFRQRLSRQLARHELPRARRAKALSERDVVAWQCGDGTGEMSIVGACERTVAAQTRISEIARGIRAHGDQRTLAQLRSDVALDLLLFGTPVGPGTGGIHDYVAERTREAAAMAEPSVAEGDFEFAIARRVVEAIPEPPKPWWDSFPGVLPPARVTVTVPLTSLLGIGDEPAEIETVTGAEFVPAWLAREIAFAAGSTWRRLVTDPHTGQALGVPSKAYAPPPKMKAWVQARDHVCRAPGCVTPASRCDLDHGVPWPRGATSENNLSGKDRRHHNHKTRGLWACDQHADGSITWTLATGRTYTTLPHSYETTAGAQVASLHALLDAGDLDALAALHTLLDTDHVEVVAAEDRRNEAALQGPKPLLDVVETSVRAPEPQVSVSQDPRLPRARVKPPGLFECFFPMVRRIEVDLPNHARRHPKPATPQDEPPF